MKTDFEQKRTKIIFPIKQDEDGYPPEGSESMWAIVNNNVFIIDNIPFFLYGVSFGDTVTAKIINNKLIYETTVKYSRHSTIRVLFHELEYLKKIRQELIALGCSSEVSHLENLISLDIPPEVSIKIIREFLDAYERENIIGYEEAAVFE